MGGMVGDWYGKFLIKERFVRRWVERWEWSGVVGCCFVMFI